MKESAMPATPFELHQVRLLDGPFREAMERDKGYMLKLDPDRLLHMFRMTAGLPSRAEPYGGWESPESELRGHFVGHYLSACAQMYAAAGDARFKERADLLVAGFAECQAAMPSQGYNEGYLSAFPEELFDRVDRRYAVWAPYYTLHKILAGLLDAHHHCGNSQALELLNHLADWLQFRVGRLSHEQMQIALGNEPGGISEALAELYAVTGKPEHLELAKAFHHELVLAPLARGEDRLDRMHANTQIPKVIGAARRYELTGEPELRALAEFFWERVALQRSYAIGGNSDDELFFPVERFDQHLSPVTAETCNTHNMLKLTRHLFAWAPSARAMDFYERALFNHILGSQDPETGMLIYFASLKPGHVKIYNTPEHSFWCCTGSGLENHARYGDTIYFRGDGELFVNLFIASELSWEEQGLTLRQETRFPEEETTRMSFRCARPLRLALKIRYPGWADGLSLTVNGQPEAVQAAPGSYLTVEREWHDGDQVELRLPMRLRLEALPGAQELAAVLYGPVVLAGALGTENMPELYLKDYYTRITPTNDWPTPAVPALVGDEQQVLAGIEPVAGQPLSFRTRGIGSPHDVELVPFAQLHHQRYTVYWRLLEGVGVSDA